jgi:LDH2 family malate/lactate/ureidoglycolate dehydrogenase
MLPTYIKRARNGGIDPAAEPEFIHEFKAIDRLNGRASFGQYIAALAVEKAAAKSRGYGIGAVSVFNGNHAGALGHFTHKLAQSGLLGFMAHNVNPAVAPFGGRKAAIGTNPLSFAFPAEEHPIVVDMATSATAKGKLYELARSGDNIPPGLALNRNGEATTSLAEALEGILLPMSGPKGYSLAVAVEMLTSVLGGGILGPEIPSFHGSPDRPQGVSMFVLAIDPSAIMPVAEYKKRAAELGEKITATPPAEGFEGVRLPGEFEAQLAEARKKEGIPVKKSMLNEINALLSD